MENQALRNIQQNLANSSVRPTFADEVVVAHTIKSGKNERGKLVKEAHLHLVFIDMTTQRPVDKIVLSPITAAGLAKALADSVGRIEKELKNRGKSVEKTKRIETDYIR